MRTFGMVAVLICVSLGTGFGVSWVQICEAQTSGTKAATQRAAQVSSPDIKQQLRSYFFDAARSGNTSMLAEFIAAKYDLNTRDEKGYTALILAAYHGNDEAVDVLMNAGADPCAADLHGNTALMGAIYKGELGIARRLLGAKCNPDQKNAAGQTAAMYAALFGRIEILQSLQDQGADLKAKDSAGNTAEQLSRGIFAQSERN